MEAFISLKNPSSWENGSHFFMWHQEFDSTFQWLKIYFQIDSITLCIIEKWITFDDMAYNISSHLKLLQNDLNIIMFIGIPLKTL